MRQGSAAIVIFAWSCLASAQVDPGAAPDALPGVLRVGHVSEAPVRLSLSTAAGYGVIDGDALDAGPHHRLFGDLSFAGRPLTWLALAGGVRGRYDVHPADAAGGDDSGVGQWWLAVRAGGGLGGGFSLGGEARLDLLGADAPDLAFLGSALSLRVMASLAPEGSPLTLSLNAGYRFDGSGNTLDRTLPPLRRGDRVSLGISDSDALLFGLAASVDVRPVEVVGELTWEPWVESGAPELGRAPLRLAAGARVHPIEELALGLLVELTLQPRASVDLTQALVPVEPRFAGMLTIAWRPRFGGGNGEPVEPEPERTVEVSGEIRGPGGEPIAGAEVIATPREQPGEGDPSEREPVRSTTGADGRYTLSGLGPGEWTLQARAEGRDVGQSTLQIAETGPPPSPPPMVLAPSVARGALRAIVRDFRGRPVRGAAVLVDEERLGETDEDGVFTADVPAGQHMVRVTAQGFREQETAVEVEANGVTVLNADLRQ